jgi:hypothetical protein
MPRKAKAKRRGRPPLAKGVARQVYSVRLPTALVARAEAYGGLTSTVEQALTAWLDEWEGRAHEILARRE